MTEPPKSAVRRRLGFAGLVLAGGFVVAAIVAGLVVSLGLYDVAASSGHPKPVAWLLHFAMQRSVAAHAPPLTPPNLDDPRLILRGATHFATGCAPCHGAPGHLVSPIAAGMTPVPPGLYDANRQFTPSELFWIVKNGVKMTAMPAWPAPQRSDEIWAMVAFLEHLPEFNTQAFARLSGEAGSDGFLSAASTMASPSTPFDPAACARCHGDKGQGRDGAFPQIAGLGADYIERQLLAFRDGSRPSGFMQTQARGLSDAQIKAAANYFSAQPRQAGGGAQPAAGEVALARGVAEGGGSGDAGPACLSCHVRGGGGEVPDLTGQPADYLATQLRLYRSGQRGDTAAAGKMAQIARRLSDQQIEAVSAYLAALPACGPGPAASPGCRITR